MDDMKVGGCTFTVIKLLGKGKGGYSYLVTDGENRYVLKQIHHEPCAYYSFGNKLESELRDYARLSECGITMPRMLKCDAERECILKEYIDGRTVYERVRDGENVDALIERASAMSCILRDAGLNIDWFPTNFIEAGGVLYYIDYECNAYSDEWSFENWGIAYWSKTPQFLEYEKAHSE